MFPKIRTLFYSFTSKINHFQKSEHFLFFIFYFYFRILILQFPFTNAISAELLLHIPIIYHYPIDFSKKQNQTLLHEFPGKKLNQPEKKNYNNLSSSREYPSH